jgi:hypothetical protein
MSRATRISDRMIAAADALAAFSDSTHLGARRFRR